MKIHILIPLCAIIAISSCTSSRLNEKRVDPEAIPAEFKCLDCVLLVTKRTSGINHRGMTNYIDKSFRKNYDGQYEMVSWEELDTNPKYKDKKKYRFVVSDRVSTGGNKTITTTTTTSSSGVSVNREIDYNYTYTMDFRIHDRLKNYTHPSIGVHSNVPAKAINRTSVYLNKVRK